MNVNEFNEMQNLDYLDRPNNDDLKQFFYLNLSFKRQQELLILENSLFIKTLNEQINKNVFSKKKENIFIRIINYFNG